MPEAQGPRGHGTCDRASEGRLHVATPLAADSGSLLSLSSMQAGVPM